MGSVAHGDQPTVWFATAYQTSYDRHEGCWTAGLEVRAASEADARVMCERMLEAVALTSEDPPPAPIKMPDGWTYAEKNSRRSTASWNSYLDMISIKGDCVDVDSDECSPGLIPCAILALALRSAGWRVEGPKP
jgi:hypothetical protein